MRGQYSHSPLHWGCVAVRGYAVAVSQHSRCDLTLSWLARALTTGRPQEVKH